MLTKKVCDQLQGKDNYIDRDKNGFLYYLGDDPLGYVYITEIKGQVMAVDFLNERDCVGRFDYDEDLKIVASTTYSGLGLTPGFHLGMIKINDFGDLSKGETTQQGEPIILCKYGLENGFCSGRNRDFKFMYPIPRSLPEIINDFDPDIEGIEPLDFSRKQLNLIEEPLFEVLAIDGINGKGEKWQEEWKVTARENAIADLFTRIVLEDEHKKPHVVRALKSMKKMFDEHGISYKQTSNLGKFLGFLDEYKVDYEISWLERKEPNLNYSSFECK